jgi:hypothetical protein
VTPGRSPTQIDAYKRRVELRRALATVEEAIALRDERGSACTVNLEGLQEDLLAALWLCEILLTKR